MHFVRRAFTAVTLALTGCGGGAAFDGRTFHEGRMTFVVGPQGEGWRRIDASHGLLAFRDESRRATILVNGRCGEDDDDVPLSALTNHLFLMFTDREIDAQETIPFDGREAERTSMRAKLDGVPMRFESFVLKKNGCVYDFVLIAEPGTFDAEKPAFERFVSGFHAESP